MIKDQLFEGRMWIGNFYIDENLWIVVSDYGTFSNQFTHSYPTLKHFLVNCNSDYLCRKFLRPEERYEVDWERTKIELKKTILERRREKQLDRNEARELWIDLEYSNCEKEYGYGQNERVEEWYEYIVEKETSESISLKKYVIEPILKLYKQQIGENND